jgi:DNA-binding transcriptional LysR family regulator
VLAARSATNKRLVRVLPEYCWTHADLSLVLPTGRHVPARVALLRDFLADALKSMMALTGPSHAPARRADP